MGSNTLQLPIIILSNETLKPGISKWVEVRSNVCKALEDYGCFEVSYDKVSMELKNSVLEAMQKFLDLPIETKQRNDGPKPYVGYINHNGLSESLVIQDPEVLEKVDEFTQLLRPDCEDNKTFSITIQKLSEKFKELDTMVRRMVLESFGIDNYLDEHLKSSSYRLRLMKYVAPPDVVDDDANVIVGAKANVEANGNDDDEKTLGLPSHTDKTFLTILYQYEIEGLEVKTKDEKWIRVKPSNNSFVVMAGDSLYAFMNGRISRPYHRVRVTEKKKTRYSIGLFSTPKSDYIIEPPKELVDDKHPRLFKPFTFGKLMSFYHTEVGRKAQSTLDAYCAISPGI